MNGFYRLSGLLFNGHTACCTKTEVHIKNNPTVYYIDVEKKEYLA
jgi:hypothetical protein